MSVFSTAASKVVNLLGITAKGQATMANSLPVTIASNQDILGITAKGQSDLLNSFPVALASDQSITTNPQPSAFVALRGISVQADAIASENGSGLASSHLQVFGSRTTDFSNPDELKTTATIDDYFKGSAMDEFPKYFLVTFGEKNYSKFSLYFTETLNVSLTVAVYGLLGDGQIWADRLTPLSPVTGYAKQISADVTTRLNFVSDGSYYRILIVATPSAEPTSGYWTLVLSAQA